MPFTISHTAVDRVTVYNLQDYPLLTIGRFSYIDGPGTIFHFSELSPIRIGNFCSIARNVGFFLRTLHRADWVTQYPLAAMPWPEGVARPVNPHSHGKADIEIGSDVWVGEGTRFLPGVTVGHGSIIGAGTVVTKNVPPYSVFAGNPGAARKSRFAERDVELLLRLEWWNWPTDKIRHWAPVICSPHLDRLRQALEGVAESAEDLQSVSDPHDRE